MKIEESLADIEREVGRMSNVLQCGEYTAQELKSEHQTLKELISDLSDLQGSCEDWLEASTIGTRMAARVEEQLGSIEDAAVDLGEAEDLLLDLRKKPESGKLAAEVACCLDRACQRLVEAVEATR